jgi:hypothetical protein
MLAFISWLIGRLQTRAELELEVIALRHQLAAVLGWALWTDSSGSGSTGCGHIASMCLCWSGRPPWSSGTARGFAYIGAGAHAPNDQRLIGECAR